MDDPQLRNEASCCPVQLPLAVSGWVFKEEQEENTDVGGVKVEKCAEDEKMNTESLDTAVNGERVKERETEKGRETDG